MEELEEREEWEDLDELEESRKSGLAIASLVCGICGLIPIPLVGFLLSVLAIVFGGVSLVQIKRNASLTGGGMAIAGLVLGIVAIAIMVILLATGVIGPRFGGRFG